MYCREPTDLVQHLAYRGSSHRLKGAARHKIDMIRLSQWGGGGYFTCFNEVPRGTGWGSQHPVFERHTVL
jgi:hypothetical protein